MSCRKKECIIFATENDIAHFLYLFCHTATKIHKIRNIIIT